MSKTCKLMEWWSSSEKKLLYMGQYRKNNSKCQQKKGVISKQRGNKITHERFDKLLKEARAELDEKKRAEMYFETQKICRDEGGTIVNMFEDWVIAASKKCRYVNVAGNWNPDGGKAAERWWFAQKLSQSISKPIGTIQAKCIWTFFLKNRSLGRWA